MDESSTASISYIVATGIPIKFFKIVEFEIQKRGFIVEADLNDKDNVTVLLSISSMLLVKLALQNDMPIKNSSHYDKFQALTLSNEAIKILKRGSKDLKIKSMWLAHCKSSLDEMNTIKDSSEKMGYIAKYYGATVATYFAWLEFYTDYLKIPAIVGFVLFLHQLFLNTVDSPLVPVFSVFLALWGTFFQEFWKRKNALLNYEWNIFGKEEVSELTDLANSVQNEKSGSSSALLQKVIRMTLSFIVLMLMVQMVTYVMFCYIAWQQYAATVYGVNSWYRYGITVAYSLCPSLFGIILTPTVSMLTNLEQHSTKSEYDTYMILKLFTVHFINSNGALLYTVFVLKDLQLLRALLGSLLVINAILNNMMEQGLPMIQAMMTKRRFEDDSRPTSADKEGLKTAGTTHGDEHAEDNDQEEDDGDEISAEMIDQESKPSALTKRKEMILVQAERKARNKRWRKLLVDELAKSSYELEDDYLEMVLQYSHVTMFAVAFPIAPLLAYVNNIFESDLDLQKLSGCQRPHATNRSSMGAWGWCLEFVNFVAVCVNCYLLCNVSSHLGTIIPKPLHFLLNSDEGRLFAMVLLEHILLGVKVVMMVVIDDIPPEIQQETSQQKKREGRELVATRIHSYTDKSRKIKEATLKEDYEEVDKLSKPDPSQLNYGIERKLAVKRLTKEDAQFFGFNPITMTCIICLPPIILWVGVSAWIYVPLALLIFYFLQCIKDKQDKKAAYGVVSDPHILRFMIDEVPSWITQSEYERLEWLNSIIHKLWPMIAVATERKILAALGPLLESKKPPFLAYLGLEKCSLGTVPPKFYAIRLHHTDETMIRLDLELRWTANLDVVLRAGTLPLPTPFELTDFRMSAELRVELTDLKDRFPSFGVLSFTCMTKPVIEFNMKVANVDSNVDLVGYSLSKLIKSIVQSILCNMALYPKRQVIKIAKEMDDKEFRSYTNLRPLGVLQIHMEKWFNEACPTSWLGYPVGAVVEIHSLDQNFTIDVPGVSNALTKALGSASKADRTVDIIVYDKVTQVVEIIVKDTSGFQIGKITQHLDKLPDAKPYAFKDRHVSEIDKRKKLSYTCLYLPLSSQKITSTGSQTPNDNERKTSASIAGSSSAATDQEVIFDFSNVILDEDIMYTDDIVRSIDAEENANLDLGIDLHHTGSLKGGSRKGLLAGVGSKNAASPRGKVPAALANSSRGPSLGALQISFPYCKGLVSSYTVGIIENNIYPYIIFSIENISISDLSTTSIKSGSADSASTTNTPMDMPKSGSNTNTAISKRTKVKPREKNPIFEESIIFTIHHPADKQLVVSIYDQSQITFFSSFLNLDSKIAEVRIPLGEFIYKDDLDDGFFDMEYSVKSGNAKFIDDTKVGFSVLWATSLK